MIAFAHMFIVWGRICWQALGLVSKLAMRWFFLKVLIYVANGQTGRMWSHIPSIFVRSLFFIPDSNPRNSIALQWTLCLQPPTICLEKKKNTVALDGLKELTPAWGCCKPVKTLYDLTTGWFPELCVPLTKKKGGGESSVWIYLMSGESLSRRPRLLFLIHAEVHFT